MTRKELAFSALDRSKTGFITEKELKKLSKKLSNQELMVLMKRVIVLIKLLQDELLFKDHVCNNDNLIIYCSLILMVMDSLVLLSSKFSLIMQRGGNRPFRKQKYAISIVKLNPHHT